MKLPTPKTDDGSGLKYVELNTDRDVTLVYIHGAFSSPAEFSLVIPFLNPQYHLLLPSLFEGQEYTSEHPFSIESLCDQLNSLITRHAKTSRAHVFGFSLGAHVALSLAARYPHLVEGSSVIASGITLFSHFSSWKQTVLPYFFYTDTFLPSKILTRNMQIGLINKTIQPASPTYAESRVSAPREGGMALCRQVVNALVGSLSRGEPIHLKARTLVIAGTASGGGKFPDSIGDARFVVGQLGKGNAESRGIEVKEGSHPWVLQVPELCAKIVNAWIERRELPLECIPL
jgi:pimeloyl-ACP methyl ester carboxylesterase